MISHSAMLFYIGISIILLAKHANCLEAESIIGGEKTKTGQHAYTVYVEETGKGAERTCTGSIIADKYILSAAHCFVGPDGEFRGKAVKVVTGRPNLTDHSVGQESKVARVYIPKDYSQRYQDIAVLELADSLELKKRPDLRKLSLPAAERVDYADTMGVVSGYGVTSVEIRENKDTGKIEQYNKKSDSRMRYAEVEIIDNKKCGELWDPVKIHDSYICGLMVQRYYFEPEGVCNGDSGGPLVLGNMVVGVTMATHLACNENHYPAMYTRVSDFTDFIKNVMDGKMNPSDARLSDLPHESL